MFLEVTGLTVVFGKTRALDSLCLSLDAGSIVVLRGENGSGKSTFLWAISGLLLPTAGEIRFSARGGTPRIGLLAHQSFLYEDMTVLENLVLTARLNYLSDPIDRSRRLLDQLGLDEQADKRVCTLSRGQIQRAAFARAVLPEPEVLLLDEPFSNMDDAASAQVCRALESLRSSDRLILVATHDRHARLPGPIREVHIRSGKILE